MSAGASQTQGGTADSRGTGRRWKVALLFSGLGLFAVAVAGWLLFATVPFDGPYSGQVLDASTGQPVTVAVVEAHWTCYDNPIPLSHQSRSVYSRSSTDEKGAFALNHPKARRGLAGTDYVFTVRAEGYIESVFIHDPSGTPLPPQTATWPFANTTVLTAMPKAMTVKLAPALPVLTKAAKSPNPLIRDTAIEKLEDIARRAHGDLRQAATSALKEVRAAQGRPAGERR